MQQSDAAAVGDPQRAPVQHFETVIIGTGFSGLLAAIRLQRNRCNDFILLERDSELGGTWRDNAYPGAEVDVPTGLYSISFIPYRFSKRYAPQRELLAYTRHIIERFGLREKTQTRRSVTRLAFDEATCRWHIETASGHQYLARFVIDASGVLANPHVPRIEGAASFEGTSFHTAKWDHSISYAGKRVGIIGSGCSAAQVVPAIAGEVGRLTLFMGKAQWIIPRSDRRYSAIERRLMTLPGIRQLHRFIIFAYHEVRFVAFRRYRMTQGISRFIKGIYARALKRNLDRYIADETLRRHMMPDYELGCRRVIPTNTYLPALSRDNVDVDISGIESITPSGIRTRDGKEIPLDIIVYATGFYAYSDLERALTFEVRGLDGRILNREWKDHPVSYKGIAVSGFPNYFKVNGPNTGTGHSSQISYMEAMVNYAVKGIMAVRRDRGIRAIDVKRPVQEQYVRKLHAALERTVWQTGGCSAFYRKDMTGIVTSLSPESMIHFIFSRLWFRLNDYRLLK